MSDKLKILSSQEAFYKDIKQLIEEARLQIVRSVNTAMVVTYWEIGKRIVQEEQGGANRAEYGKFLLKNLSEQLTNEFGKGFDESNLRNMRLFFSAFPIRDTLRHELSWSHYRLLLRVENEEARKFYLSEAVQCAWSTRQLERQITSMYYQRLLSSKDKNVIKTEAQSNNPPVRPEDILKDPYILEFLDIKENTNYLEHDIESQILDKLQEFLLELGKGFSFISRQKRITTEAGKHYYIDLEFYNYILKCFVLIDLKIGALTPQDVGQMDLYVRMYDDIKRSETDNPTIGIILCSDRDETVVKYSILAENKQLFAAKYQLYLPTEKELQKIISQ